MRELLNYLRIVFVSKWFVLSIIISALISVFIGKAFTLSFINAFMFASIALYENNKKNAYVVQLEQNDKVIGRVRHDR
jgi:hypothetical protein